jgi:hypothetical protein
MKLKSQRRQQSVQGVGAPSCPKIRNPDRLTAPAQRWSFCLARITRKFAAGEAAGEAAANLIIPRLFLGLVVCSFQPHASLSVARLFLHLFLPAARSSYTRSFLLPALPTLAPSAARSSYTCSFLLPAPSFHPLLSAFSRLLPKRFPLI